jgi:hypothetical protein
MSDPPSPPKMSAPRFSMSLEDAVFWIALTVFGTGLYIVADYHIYGLVLIIIGVLGLAWSSRGHMPRSSWKTGTLILAMLITLSVAGYDIYDRHYNQKPTPPDTNPSPPLGPTYVKDIQFDWDSKDPLKLYVTAAVSAPKLRIVLQSSQYFPSPDDVFSSVYPSIILGEFTDVVEGQIIRIPVISLASPPYPGDQLVFGGKPSDTAGNPYFVNSTLHLVRLFFLVGDSGEPQNYRFAFFVTPDTNQRIIVLRDYDLDNIEKWRRE